MNEFISFVIIDVILLKSDLWFLLISAINNSVSNDSVLGDEQLNLKVIEGLEGQKRAVVRVRVRVRYIWWYSVPDIDNKMITDNRRVIRRRFPHQYSYLMSAAPKDCYTYWVNNCEPSYVQATHCRYGR